MITPSGNRIHNRHVYSRTLVPLPDMIKESSVITLFELFSISLVIIFSLKLHFSVLIYIAVT